MQYNSGYRLMTSSCRCMLIKTNKINAHLSAVLCIVLLPPSQNKRFLAFPFLFKKVWSRLPTSFSSSSTVLQVFQH